MDQSSSIDELCLAPSSLGAESAILDFAVSQLHLAQAKCPISKALDAPSSKMRTLNRHDSTVPRRRLNPECFSPNILGAEWPLCDDHFLHRLGPFFEF